ncbi:MAG: membrane dipeptidase [Phycisphaerales bacterium]|nr:membrane dipeptidase [Phycisphaerales bacterium]
MILDTTHLCDQSFYQALDHFQGPLVASHQNCRALVPGDRQFSDEQIKLILQRDGLLGTAFDAWMLYPNWERGKTSRQVVSIEAAADHIDHICQLAGDAKHICLGTDLDGGYGTEQTPTGLEQYRDLQKLSDILSQRGYPTTAIQDILGGNGFEFFQRHLPNKSP